MKIDNAIFNSIPKMILKSKNVTLKINLANQIDLYLTEDVELQDEYIVLENIVDWKY